MLALRLYVSHGSVSSAEAITNVERLRAKLADQQVDVEVVDVRENPDVTESDRILATPTLLKLSPLPQRRIVGDLRDVELVARYLTAGTEGATS